MKLYLLICVVLTGLSSANPVFAEQSAIEKKLDVPVQANFKKTPLQKAIQQITAEAEIKYQYSKDISNEELATPITLTLGKKIPAKGSLGLILGTNGLVFKIDKKKGTIFIRKLDPEELSRTYPLYDPVIVIKIDDLVTKKYTTNLVGVNKRNPKAELEVIKLIFNTVNKPDDEINGEANN